VNEDKGNRRSGQGERIRYNDAGLAVSRYAMTKRLDCLVAISALTPDKL
jgi:hypothetical protein